MYRTARVERFLRRRRRFRCGAAGTKLCAHHPSRRQVRPAGDGCEGGDGLRHPGGGHRRAAVRHRGSHPGVHGVVRGGAGRQGAPGEGCAQPERALHHAVPDPRGEELPHREGGRSHTDGGGRVLRHRDVWLHWQRARAPPLGRGGGGIPRLCAAALRPTDARAWPRIGSERARGARACRTTPSPHKPRFSLLLAAHPAALRCQPRLAH